LEKLLRASQPGLPRLPEKSVFRKAAGGSAFLNKRQLGLDAFIRAAVAQDPQLSNPTLMSFLETSTLMKFPGVAASVAEEDAGAAASAIHDQSTFSEANADLEAEYNFEKFNSSSTAPQTAGPATSVAETNAGAGAFAIHDQSTFTKAHADLEAEYDFEKFNSSSAAPDPVAPSMQCDVPVALDEFPVIGQVSSFGDSAENSIADGSAAGEKPVAAIFSMSTFAADEPIASGVPEGSLQTSTSSVTATLEKSEAESFSVTDAPADVAPLQPLAHFLPLDEVGYSVVAVRCSNREMEEFIRRVIDASGGCVTNIAELRKIVPHFSGQLGTKSYERLVEELEAAMAKPEKSGGFVQRRPSLLPTVALARETLDQYAEYANADSLLGATGVFLRSCWPPCSTDGCLSGPVWRSWSSAQRHRD